MKIAIIEDDKDYQGLLITLFHGQKWDVVFFNNAEQFGTASLDFDVIIADCCLPGASGQTLIKSISSKTKATLALMTSELTFRPEDGKAAYVANLLHKSNRNGILQWLTYVEFKRQYNQTVQDTEDTYSELTTMTNGLRNGYHAEVADGTLVIGLSNLLSKKSKETLLKDFEQYKYRAVVYYQDKVQMLNSEQLGQLADMWNVIRERTGTMALVKPRKDLLQIINTCNLNNVIHIAPDRAAAISHVKE